mgnify:CR=1 FL=1
MVRTFRRKLLAIVGSVALAFVIMLASSAVVAYRVDAELARIEQQFLPRIEVGPRLVSEFENVTRAFQDAVASHDTDSLDRAREAEKIFLDELLAARGTFEERDASELRASVEDYFLAALDVSRRLIAEETGEKIIEAMSDMQKKRVAAKTQLDRTIMFDRKEMVEAFANARQAQNAVRRVHFAVTLGYLAFVFGFALWLTRVVIRSLVNLGDGLTRFGKGDFAQPIVVEGQDELATVAGQANAMALNLQSMNAARDRAEWFVLGLTGLANELRGDLTPDEVADRAIRYIARYLEVPCGALYVNDGEGMLCLRGRYGFAEEGRDFKIGDGIVGQAAREDTITVIDDPPDDYLRVRSALGESKPRALVLAPIVRAGHVRCVLELATFKTWTNLAADFVTSLQETLAIAIEVALAREATQELLERTERLNARLQAQEEELRSTNEELRTQQEELQQNNEELTEQARALELQRKALEAKNEELKEARQGLENKARELTTVSTYKSQFLANMSHELRTPLNSMLLLSNLLAENSKSTLTPKQVEYAQTIHAAGNDLLALINQVLDIAKIEAGKQEVRLGDVSIKKLAEHAERVFGPLAHRKDLIFLVEVASDVPESVHTDEQRLTQIMTNLLGNAIKFTERGDVALRIGRVAPGVRFARQDLTTTRAIAFAVSDTGVGISKANQERIFSPFEQVDSAEDRKFGGTGLGLTIARELATLLGGELHVDSTPGKGSTFTLFLPITHATSKVRARSMPPPPHLLGDDVATLPPDDEYLLVVEDDRAFADAVGDIIRAHGLRYVGATDGETGLAIAKAKRPRGIILDVKLPGVDGWTVMERLRSEEALARIPVHFVSSLDESARGAALGAIGWVTKPTSRADLVAVIDKLETKSAELQVLVVAGSDVSAALILDQVAHAGLAARRVTSADDALDAVSHERFGCIIVDPEVPNANAVTLVETLAARAVSPKPAIVVHTDASLEKEDVQRLESVATIVLRQGSSEERLLHEIHLFVQRIQEGLAPTRLSEPPLLAPDVRFDGRQVLLVDDDMRTVYALSATLRSKGMKVVVADNGEVALRVLDQHPSVDAVLMDIMMPHMDGYEATRRIRNDTRFVDLPIIALTAKAMKSDRDRCIEAGATEYLPKPVNVDRLLAVLHKLLASKEAHATT